MNHPRPSSRCLPNRVTIAAVTFTADPASARTPFYGSESAPYPCAVQRESSEEISVHGRQQEVHHYNVIFADRPPVKQRDRLTWIDGAGLGRILIADEAADDEAGQSAIWTVKATHTPARAQAM